MFLACKIHAQLLYFRAWQIHGQLPGAENTSIRHPLLPAGHGVCIKWHAHREEHPCLCLWT